MVSNIAKGLLAIGAFVASMCLLGPWWSVYEFNSDEGLNLQKAVLVAQGHSLYTEIWSDQPPLLTWVLAEVHDLFPFSLTAARATVIAFSAMLVVCLYRVVERFAGRFAAVTAIFLLVTSKLFLHLSVSVMIGLPAVALLVLAIDLATTRMDRYRMVLIAAAGAVFCLAFLTKMFALLALPGLFVALWQTAGTGRATRYKAVAAFAGGFFLAAAATYWALETVPLEQLLSPHMSARSAQTYEESGGFGDVIQYLSKQTTLAFYFTCLFGLATFLKRPGGPLLVPIVWLATGLAVLSSHRPLWDHQTLILLPPLCWLGGAGFQALFRREERHPVANWFFDKRYVAAVLWSGLAILFIVGAVAAVDDIKDVRVVFRQAPGPSAEIASIRLSLSQGDSNVVITDKPIDAYHMGKTVPPELAGWSEKRMKTGNITENDLLRQVVLRPESEVLLRRFEYRDATLDRISQTVTPVAGVTSSYTNTGIHHFASASRGTPAAERIIANLPRIARLTLGGVGGSLRRPRQTSNDTIPNGTLVARPPGSAQELGACLVAASRAFQSETLMLEAVGVGAALSCAQTPSGGWEKTALPPVRCGLKRFPPGTDTNETFDDGTVPSIVYFAFDLSDRFRELSFDPPSWLDAMITRALSFAIEKQLENGAWPQSEETTRYHPLPTLNDDVTTGMIRLLVAAYERLGEKDYLDAAIRGGEFLLAAQGAGDQAAFAQQYSPLLKPVSARAFEPAAYASLETAYAINALLDLHLETGDERYRRAAEAAAAWLDASTMDRDLWARFYEIGTNRPLFATRAGEVVYDLQDVPESERASYRRIGGGDVFPEIAVALQRMDMLDAGPDALRDFDKTLSGEALLAATPTARLPLDAEAAAGPFPTGGSTRAFAEYCAGLVAGGGESLD